MIINNCKREDVKNYKDKLQMARKAHSFRCGKDSASINGKNIK